jgi:hypothetical protein
MLSNIFWDFGILDPEKTYSGSRIPDPGVKKSADPGSGTLLTNVSESGFRSGKDTDPEVESDPDLDPYQ